MSVNRTVIECESFSCNTILTHYLNFTGRRNVKGGPARESRTRGWLVSSLEKALKNFFFLDGHMIFVLQIWKGALLPRPPFGRHVPTEWKEGHIKGAK